MGTYKLVFKRPPDQSVQQHAMQKAIVKLIEQHQDEFNGYLADEINRIESIKCRALIPFARG